MQVSKLETVNTRLIELLELHKKGKFRSYIDLYKCLVGYQDQQNEDDTDESSAHNGKERQTYWIAIEALRSHFEETKKAISHTLDFDRHRFFINNDYDWTYVEVTFGYESRYRSLVKLYVPVSYSDLPEAARLVFDFLFSLKKKFCYKIAHRDRRDNICIWIMRDEFEKVIHFLQTLKPQLLPAPTFCPEYKNIGVTRELMSSFNEIISSTLHTYLVDVENPTLANYIEFLDNYWSSRKDRSYTAEFDKQIIKRSLNCILHGKCPVTSDSAITDFDIEKD